LKKYQRLALILSAFLAGMSNGQKIGHLGVLCTVPSHFSEVGEGELSRLSSLGAVCEFIIFPDDTSSSPLTFSRSLSHLSCLKEHDIKTFASISLFYKKEGLCEEWVSEVGETFDGERNFFNPQIARWHNALAIACAEALKNTKGVEGIFIGIPSYWGEVEIFSGTNWFDHRFYTYSPSCRSSFITYLKQRYKDLETLNNFWGTNYASWDEVNLPKPLRNAQAGTPDLRPLWLDYTTWRAQYLTNYVINILHQIRSKTDKPIGVKIGVGWYESEMGLNAGVLIKSLSTLKPFFIDSTNAHSLADLKYILGLAHFYGARWLICENEYARVSPFELYKMVINYLLSGADMLNFCQFMRLRDANDEPTETYHLLEEFTRLASDFPSASFSYACPIAFFHAANSCNFRPPAYDNLDVIKVYDEQLTLYPAFASWGRALNFPDVIDERMVLDGALKDKKLLIIPNTGVTITHAQVMEMLSGWVREGGWLVGFGTECLANAIDEHGFIKYDSPLGGLVGKISVKRASASLKIEDGWNCSLKIFHAEDVNLFKAQGFKPIVGNEEGWMLVGYKRVGKGGVVFSSEPVSESLIFKTLMPQILKSLSFRAGISQPAQASGVSGILFAGADEKRGRLLFYLLPPPEPTECIKVQFNPALCGPARLVVLSRAPLQVFFKDASTACVTSTLKPHALYNPTNTRRQENIFLTFTVIDFDLPNELEIKPQGVATTF